MSNTENTPNNAPDSGDDRAEAEKDVGNRLFAGGDYANAKQHYLTAIEICQLPASPVAAACHCNIAACALAEADYELAIHHCSEALNIDPEYVKALVRRSKAYESLHKYEDAITDIETLITKVKGDVYYSKELDRLKRDKSQWDQAQQAEMIEKLKDMGNSLLGKFGMSLDNFKATKDPNSGSYSINFQQ